MTAIAAMTTNFNKPVSADEALRISRALEQRTLERKERAFASTTNILLRRCCSCLKGVEQELLAGVLITDDTEDILDVVTQLDELTIRLDAPRDEFLALLKAFNKATKRKPALTEDYIAELKLAAEACLREKARQLEKAKKQDREVERERRIRKEQEDAAALNTKKRSLEQAALHLQLDKDETETEPPKKRQRIEHQQVKQAFHSLCASP